MCADLVVASDDARIGTPYARVWGCHLTGMWIYRLGLAKAKYYALTGEWVSGTEAADIGLINFACPLEERDGPFGDYSQAPPDRQPRRRSELGR